MSPPSIADLPARLDWPGRNAETWSWLPPETGVDIRADLAAQGVVLVCPPDADVLDEAGRAYKDIEDVMRYQSDLVEPLMRLRPLGVVKGYLGSPVRRLQQGKRVHDRECRRRE